MQNSEKGCGLLYVLCKTNAFCWWFYRVRDRPRQELCSLEGKQAKAIHEGIRYGTLRSEPLGVSAVGILGQILLCCVVSCVL